jgi:TRAP-type C4-dicarboxylate transport system permease small subunit
VRTVLNAIYRTSGLAAGFFFVMIAVLSLAQIIGRLLQTRAHSFDEFAGYAMAASAFLGLAWTLRSGEHIRMTLGIDQLRGHLRRSAEVVCLALAALVVGYFAWAAVQMTITSYQFGDVSQGLDPVKLWIPQSGMAIGLVILFIAFLDDLVVTLRGRVPSYAAPREQDADAATFER